MDQLTNYVFKLELGSPKVESQLAKYFDQTYKALNSGQSKLAEKSLNKIEKYSQKHGLIQNAGGKDDDIYIKLPERRLSQYEKFVKEEPTGYDEVDLTKKPSGYDDVDLTKKPSGYDDIDLTKPVDSVDMELVKPETYDNIDQARREKLKAYDDVALIPPKPKTSSPDHYVSIPKDAVFNRTDSQEGIRAGSSVDSNSGSRDNSRHTSRDTSPRVSPKADHHQIVIDPILKRFYLPQVDRSKAVAYLEKHPKIPFILRDVSESSLNEPEVKLMKKYGFVPYKILTAIKNPITKQKEFINGIIFINDAREISTDYNGAKVRFPDLESFLTNNYAIYLT